MTDHEIALYGADVCGTETRIEELMRLVRQDAERKHLEWLDSRTLGEKWSDDRWGKNCRVTDNPRSAEAIHD